MDKTIVILGGGIGGVVAARELRKHLGTRHRIVVVDRNTYHEFPPSFPWLLIGWRSPEVLRKPLALLEKYAIEFKQGVVDEIGTAGQTVTVGGESIRYDYLIVALGGVSSPSSIRGWGAGCYSLASVEDAVALGTRLAGLESGRIAVVNADESGLYPPLAYETTFLLESYFTRKGKKGIRIDLYTPEPSALHLLGDPASSPMARLLGERGIQFHPHARLVGIGNGGRLLRFDDGSASECDLLLCVPPLRAPELIAHAGLDDGGGWLAVDRATMRSRVSTCFGVGNVTRMSADNGSILPRLGSFAASQAEVVAGTIAHELGAHVVPKIFDGVGYCFIETGNGRAAYVSANYFASPSPLITYHEPNVTYHWGKIVFEKYWMWRWL